MNTTHHLISQLKQLRMPGIAENLMMRLREAEENALGYAEFLTLLVGDELANREANILAKRVRNGFLDPRLTFESFDFRFNNNALPSQTIRDLATCHFVERQQNLIICGPPGIGKTHVAHGIAHEVCRRGQDALVFKTHKLLEQLDDPLNPKRATRLWKRCFSTKLLILDDFGFRRYDAKECEILYALSDERLSRSSTIITSNRPVEDWYGVFPDPVIGGAVLDRFVSGAVKLIVERARSYRKEGIRNKNDIEKN